MILETRPTVEEIQAKLNSHFENLKHESLMVDRNYDPPHEALQCMFARHETVWTSECEESLIDTIDFVNNYVNELIEYKLEEHHNKLKSGFRRLPVFRLHIQKPLTVHDLGDHEYYKDGFLFSARLWLEVIDREEQLYDEGTIFTTCSLFTKKFSRVDCGNACKPSTDNDIKKAVKQLQYLRSKLESGELKLSKSCLRLSKSCL